MKSSTISLGNLSLDIPVLLRTRMLIQANSGGGKSWLLRRLAEQLYGKVQVIIIDPEGEYPTLREKYGYVLVGSGGETPADPRSAALVAEKLLELRASAVCDLFECFRKTPQSRHLWVKTFCNALLDAPKKLWHPMILIIDEFHKFVPEKGAGESEASEAVIGIGTAGRKRGYCLIGATQRLGKVRKDVSAELLNRMVGPTFEDVDLDRAADLLSVLRSDRQKFFEEMRVLEPGNFYALGRAICKQRTLVKVGPVKTTHPEIGSTDFTIGPPPTPEMIKDLLPKLADLPKEAEDRARTSAEMKARIRELETEVRKKASAQPDESALAKAIERGRQEARKELAARMRMLESALTNQQRVMVGVAKSLTGAVVDIPAYVPPPKSPVIVQTDVAAAATPRQQSHQAASDQDGTGKPLPPGERAVLIAAAQHQEDGVERDQVSILTGYRRSSRDAYISRLVPKGYLVQRGLKFYITDAGIAALGDAYEPLPTGDDLIEYWKRTLPPGERAIFVELVSAYPHAISRADLDERTKYKRSSRDAYIGRLGARRLVTVSPNGVSASERLFQ